MSETTGQMKTRHKLEMRNLDKEFKAKLKIAKGKDKKREVKAQQKEAEKAMKERHAKEIRSREVESTGSGDLEKSGSAELEEKDTKSNGKGNGDVKAQEMPEKQLSRAQKRRMKKKAKEEEMRRKHKEEASQMTDYKAIENERMKERLKPQGLTVHEVEADGNCLFRACEHQLSLLNEAKCDEDFLSHTKLREQTGEVLAKHFEDYMPYLLKDDGTLMSKEEYKKYCEKIGTTSAWGGQAEIAALTRLLGRQIIVHSAFADDIKMGVPKDLPPLRISYHKHYYSLGAHYNSVVTQKGT